MGNSTNTWTAAEDELLTRLWTDNVPALEIARQLPGRSEAAVTNRARKLDLPFHAGLGRHGNTRRYDQDDDFEGP